MRVLYINFQWKFCCFKFWHFTFNDSTPSARHAFASASFRTTYHFRCAHKLLRFLLFWCLDASALTKLILRYVEHNRVTAEDFDLVTDQQLPFCLQSAEGIFVQMSEEKKDGCSVTVSQLTNRESFLHHNWSQSFQMWGKSFLFWTYMCIIRDWTYVFTIYLLSGHTWLLPDLKTQTKSHVIDVCWFHSVLISFIEIIFKCLMLCLPFFWPLKLIQIIKELLLLLTSVSNLGMQPFETARHQGTKC